MFGLMETADSQLQRCYCCYSSLSDHKKSFRFGCLVSLATLSCCFKYNCDDVTTIAITVMETVVGSSIIIKHRAH